MTNVSWESLYNGDHSNFMIIHAFGKGHLLRFGRNLPLEFDAARRSPPYCMAEHPEKLNERDVLSCSLIKIGMHIRMWGAAGIILRVPAQDIVATGEGDAWVYDFADELRRKKNPGAGPRNSYSEKCRL